MKIDVDDRKWLHIQRYILNILHVLLVDEQTGHTHTSTNAHTGEENLLLLPPALAQTGDDLARTGAAERVTQRNSTSPWVELLVVDLECLETVYGHGSEGLVKLDEVNVLEGDVELGEELGDGDGRADTHDPGWQTSDGGANVLGEDGLAELLGSGALHHEDGSGTVCELRRVSGV